MPAGRRLALRASQHPSCAESDPDADDLPSTSAGAVKSPQCRNGNAAQHMCDREVSVFYLKEADSSGATPQR